MLRPLVPAFLLTLFTVVPTAQTAGAIPKPEYRLRMYHTHTGERIDVVYRRGGDYDRQALARLDRFLRDHRTGDVHEYDPALFDLLSELTAAAGRPGGELHIICGYRSAWSNEFLRATSTGVAKNSLHLRAAAIDVRLPGVKTAALREAALKLRQGGVGYYPASDFIHVDTGRVRSW